LEGRVGREGWDEVGRRDEMAAELEVVRVVHIGA